MAYELLRKIELGCGVLTGLLAIAFTLMTLHTTQEIALRLGDEAPILQTTLVWTVFFIFPALLVALGSYAHAVKQRSSGRAMLLIGSSFITILFLLFLRAAYYVLTPQFRLHLLLTAMAIVTSIISLTVRDK